jgi:hypothetical protein
MSTRSSYITSAPPGVGCPRHNANDRARMTRSARSSTAFHRLVPALLLLAKSVSG